MATIDWIIFVGFILFISTMAYSTRRYTKSVADFLAANRCAGKYILAMGDGMAALGAISIIAGFQVFLEGGFTRLWWWESLWYPISIFCAISGWVIYRFRQTKALTMAQFFEMRYSRGVRVFAGILAFLAGIINFGIFPSVGARFFLYFCDLPPVLPLGGYELDTYAIAMASLILIAIGFTCVGGQIAVLITDFIQSVFCNIVFIAILVCLYLRFDWGQIASAISAVPNNQSMVNPFKISNLENYNLFFYLIAIFSIFYGAYTWQGQQGYNTSAKNAHEAKMSKVLGYLRMLTPNVLIVMMAICTFTLLHHADFSQPAVRVNDALSLIDNDQIKSQMVVPVTMRYLLPVGISGLFCAAMFAAFISTHDSYLHSWGSIFIQDIILPLRKRPLTPRQHIRYLRLSIIFVGIFIFTFSYYVIQKVDIIMFFALAGNIFLGPAGALVIGGLYWKRGTTAGAYAAMVVGLILSVFGFVFVLGWTSISGYIQNDWPAMWLALEGLVPELNRETFIFTAYELFFFTEIACTVAYIVVSLLTKKTVFNLNQMLHQNQSASENEVTPEEKTDMVFWKKCIGYSKNLSWDDKLIIICAYAYAFLALGIVAAGSLCYFIFGITDKAWLSFWHGYCWFFFGFLVVFSLWLGIGGFFDLKKMLSLLAIIKQDPMDDGRVVTRQNLDEKTTDPP